MEYASAAGSSAMTIYDGDDPTLPMWMSCQVDANNRWIRYNGTIRSVAALNGIILAGANGADITDSLLSRMDLICDKLERHFDSNVHQIDSRGIVHRNSDFKITSTGTQSIVNRYVNDVAMTVRPNAPIDADTGLPVPTIAVATDGGVSVIKDDGTVVDYTYSSTNATIRYVTFTDSGLFYLARSYSSDANFYGYHYLSIAASDTSAVPDRFYSYQENANQYQLTSPIGGVTTALKNVVNAKGEIVIGTTSFSSNPGNGIYKIIETGEFRKELINHTTSDYNTGWMNGDIKLATLSDTDTTNVTGSELITNGTFASDTAGWAGVSGTIASISSQLRLTGGGTSSTVAYAQQSFATTIGKAYTVSVDFISVSGGTNRYIYIGTSASGAQRFDTVQLSNANVVVGTNTFTFTAQSTSTLLSLGTYEAQVALWDNVTVRLAEPDRSVNGNGLQVFGTVTKTAVATGADLVAIWPFYSSNYLATL